MKKNPLASARSQKATSGSRRKKNAASSSSNTKAEQLWHKRSGGGLHLFVEYYCEQPEGVVIRMNEEEENSSSPVIVTVSESQSTTATATNQEEFFATAGMSRAAQRRRKKKRKRNDAEVTEVKEGNERNDATESGGGGSDAALTVKSNNVVCTFQRFRLYDDRLLLTFHEHLRHNRHNNPHLKLHASNYESFLEALSTPLPITFRLRRSLTQKGVLQLQTELRREPLFAGHVQPITFDNTIFYAHQGLDKESLPRTSPELKQYLNERSLDGSLARQELGSMLPVWLLERTGIISSACSGPSKCRVLDMCASPGSKTLQIAELIAPHGGTVRANDVHETRLQTLQEAIQRSGVPGLDQVLKYANFDATKYPLPKTETKKYNIVLCDVPCSGDGTSRKDPHIIPNWVPSIGNRLHATQLQILIRAMQCVQVDGVVSYSTCSLNPVEDEAVVAAALQRMEKAATSLSFEILRVLESPLNGLVLRPGVKCWKVADYSHGQAMMEDDDKSSDDEEHRPKLKWHPTYEEAKSMEMHDDDNMCESLWPPSEEALDHMNIERCLRLLPQDQDTGGFFVTLIKRLS